MGVHSGGIEALEASTGAIPGIAEVKTQLDALVILYLILSFIGFAALLQFLGIYRERIRDFNSFVVRRVLQIFSGWFEQKYFNLRPNEIVTRAHLNMFELVVRTTVDFFYDAPNLITFIIGLLQVVSTYDPEHPFQAKKINLIALVINYAYTIVREVSMYLVARDFDDSRNSRIFKLLSDSTDAPSLTPVASMDICANDILRLDYGESFPAESRILHSTCKHTLINTKEDSGEDCSGIFSIGDIVPLGSRVSLQGACMIVQVTATRNTVSADGTHRRLERFPEHMNKYLTIANLFALALLSIVAAISVVHVIVNLESEKNPNEIIFRHFFSVVAQLNILIPSMRWVILYFLFVFLVDAAYPAVTIQSHAVVRKLDAVEIVYTDKTGTLTDSDIAVSAISEHHGLAALAAACDMPADILLAAVVLACNDTQPGNGEGTSPEEMVIADFLRSKHSIWIESNPLAPSADMLLVRANGKSLAVTVQSRSGYLPNDFCRIAEIQIGHHSFQVRQGGSDRMASACNDAAVMAAELMAAKENPERALAWTVTFAEKTYFCARATFSNPPRASSCDLVGFFRTKRVAVRMITGDGLEAAKHIANSVGILTKKFILRQDFSTDIDFFLELALLLDASGGSDPVTVLIEGGQLMRIIGSDRHDTSFLKNRRVNMVIYRTKSSDKAVIVQCTQKLGVLCCMIGDAANDKHALALPDIVSVSLRHGAAPCRVVADVLVTEPGDLVDLFDRCKSLHISGGKALLVNTCLVGSVISGLVWVGLFNSGFQLLAKKNFLYADPYDTRFMLIFSSLLFAPSACAAVMARHSADPLETVKVYPWFVLSVGLVGGVLAGFIGPKSHYGTWMLAILVIVGMVSHARIAGDSFFAAARSGGGRRVEKFVNIVNKRVTRIAIVVVYLVLLFVLG